MRSRIAALATTARRVGRDRGLRPRPGSSRTGVEAPGWAAIEKDAKEGKLDWRLFDRDAWVLVRGKEAPTCYEGFVPELPADGVYVDHQGRPAYVVGGREVAGPREVIAALGPQAEELLQKLGDPDAVLERLGRAF
ncbi:MAG: hypothetical protein HY744_26080 [Deltaproteobacteria bacterium]|nr:hypothetical protein [Deltaproteobacteria bacterium]